MGTFNVELKKIVDDSYDIEIGFHLEDKLISDLKAGLVGKINKFAIVTDSIVKDLYAKPILDKLVAEGYKADIFVFEAGEKQKTRETKAMVEDAMLESGYRRDCCIIAVGGGVVVGAGGTGGYLPARFQIFFTRSVPRLLLRPQLPRHRHRGCAGNVPSDRPLYRGKRPRQEGSHHPPSCPAGMPRRFHERSSSYRLHPPPCGDPHLGHAAVHPRLRRRCSL